MANISKIKLPNGSEYNVKDTVSGYTTNTGTVTQVKVGTTGYDPVNGVVSLPAYPSGGGAVDDVQVNGTSVVSSGVANIPLVSSASAGVAPKGTAVSTQSQSTKFLRQDGTWAAPSYTTNTTYTFAEGTTDGAFKVTPSSGSSTSVPVHNVVKKTGDTLTGIFTFNGGTNEDDDAPVILKSSALDLAANDYGGGDYVLGIRFYDKNNYVISYITNRVNHETGNKYLTLGQFNKTTSGNTVDNYIKIGTNKSGDKFYELASPSAFRTAIGVENKSATSGGTDISLVTTGEKYTWNNMITQLIGGSISSGDLDDYTTIGHYYVNSTGASSVSNLPVALAGYLEVVQPSTTSGSVKLQRYTAISNNTVVGVYERNYNNNSWQAWKQIGEDTFLPLAGGTLTGDLTIAKASPVYYTKKTGLTIDTSTNNGVSTDTTSYTIHADSTDAYFGRFRSVAYSDGRVASLIDARNMKTDGTRVSNYLGVGVNKDGTRYFVLPNDSVGDGRKAFREALNIKDSPTVLEPNITSSQSVSTGTYKSLGSFDLTAGTWIISYKAQFSGHDDTKLRRIMLTSSSDSNSPWADSRITVHASHDGVIDIGWTTMVKITSSSVTRYLTAYQNSGASLSVTGYVKAIKVINV